MSVFAVLAGSYHSVLGQTQSAGAPQKAARFEVNFPLALDLFDPLSDSDSDPFLLQLDVGAVTNTGARLTELSNAVAKSPRDAKTYQKRGNFYLSEGKTDLATRDFNKAAELDPKWPEPHIGLAKVAERSGHPEKSIAEYTKALGLDPQNPSAWIRRGEYWVSQSRLNEAVADFSTAIKLSPTKTIGYHRRGDAYFNQELYAQSLADYNQIVAMEPNSAIAYELQGKALTSLGRYDDAIGSFTKSVEKNSRRASTQSNFGMVYLLTRSYDSALDHFAQAIALDPKFAEVYTNRGRLYFERKNWNSALTDLNGAIELNPASARALFYRSLVRAESEGPYSHVYSDAAKLAPIVADVVKAIQLDPKLTKEYAAAARTYVNNTRREAALALLSGVTTATPNDTSGWLQLGDIQVANFDSKAAIASYDKALSLNPKLGAAYAARAMAYYNSARPYNDPNFALAIRDFKTYLKTNPKDTAALAKLGLAQYNNGQPQDGVESFRRLLAMDNSDMYAHLALGLGLAIQGDKAAALQEIGPALKTAKPAQIKQARSDIGNAVTHFPNSQVLKDVMAAYPTEDEDDDDNSDVMPYFV